LDHFGGLYMCVQRRRWFRSEVGRMRWKSSHGLVTFGGDVWSRRTTYGNCIKG
jgi:hypothetical protein